jgi:hypothetical protein
LIAVALGLTGLTAYSLSASAADDLRLSQNIPGDSKPIILHADEIITWTDGNRRLFLLKGTVLVEQGVVHLRMKQGAAWTDQEQTRRTGIVRMNVYAEDSVQLENGADIRTGPTARIDLNTRGEVRLRAQRSKIVQQARPDDPLYRRALELTLPVPGAATPPASNPTQKLQRTSAHAGTDTIAKVISAQWSGPEANQPGPGPPNPNQPPFAGPAPPDLGGASASPGQAPAPLPPIAATAPPPAGALNPAPGPPLPPSGVPAVDGGVVPGAPAIASPAPLTGPPGPAPAVPPVISAPPREIRLVPRTAAGFQQDARTLPTGELAYFLTGGIILTVRDLRGIDLLDIEADRVVVWTHGNAQRLLGNMRTPQGHVTRDEEFYLSGNVEIREQNGRDSRTLRADEVYYDVGRNVAVARNADLEFKQPHVPDPIHFRADEILQLSATQFKGYHAQIFSSRLPSDPGLVIYVNQGTLDEKQVPKTTLWGKQVINRTTGQPETEQQRLFRGNDMFLELESVPIFYLPYLQGDANDPLGPLENINYKVDRIFGNQINTTFNLYDLIGIDPIPGTRWRLFADYMEKRGPALGTDYDYAGKDLFDLPGRYWGLFKAYGIYDTGTDDLGGGRGKDDNHPLWRGRLLERHLQDLPEDFSLQLQVSVLSDKNFLEQYYKNEFDRDVNQETFAYLKQQRDNWAWTVLAEPNIRNWVNETEWLPRVDGYLIGQSFFDRLTYNAWASAGYGRLRVTDVPPPPFDLTTRDTNTGRFDLTQELSVPFTLGPVRLVPYGVLDLTYYTEDLTGNDRGRFYGAGGIRASMPLTRLYPDVQSELLNLNGINHKIVVSSNFYAAHSDTSFTLLPQLDRLNDDATDQAVRDIRPLEPTLNPQHGLELALSPMFDPQLYAIRRLVDSRIDTRDSIEELEVDIRQRLQTKRGYPGMQHIIDWMTLDLSGSFFPEKDENFGESFAFLQYDYTWNIGDRTALVSTGWVDPIDNGPRVFTVGAFLNRPDRTNFYVGYREIDPVNSQAVTGAITYVFSPKYAMTASSTYDFGTNQSLSNALVFTRMGTDLQVSLGFTYNAILNNFGFTFELLPNLVPEAHRVPGMPAFGSSALGR